ENYRLVRQGQSGPKTYWWTTNTCNADDASDEGVDNPDYPVVTCSADTSPPPVGSVRWAAVAYEEYDDPYSSVSSPGGYRRGCANECEETLNPAECYACVVDDWGAGEVSFRQPGQSCETSRVCDGHGNCGDCVP